MFKNQNPFFKAADVKNAKVLTASEMKKAWGGNQTTIAHHLNDLYGADGLVVEDINQV